MKKLLLVALYLVLLAIPVYTQSPITGWCQQGNNTVSTVGLISTTKVQRSFPSCTVTVLDAGTANLSTIFSDAGGTPLGNPFTATASGYYSFYTNNGTYDIRLSGGGISSPFIERTAKIGDATTGIGGSGTANRIAKFTAGTTLGNSTIFDNGTNIGIGTVTPSAAALLDLTSTTSVFIPPRMTTGQRDAISSPPNGSLIWNTTTGAFNQFNGSWSALAGGGGISTINPGGLSGPTITFATGTTGTDFNIAGAANTVTLHLPDASASNRGVITTGSQTIAGSKTLTGAITTVGDILQQTIGGCDPLLPPNLVGAQTIKIGSCSSIADSGAGDFRQGSFWTQNSGSRPTVAVSGIAKNTGGPGQAFGGNFGAFADCSGCIANGAEIDMGILTAGGIGHGLVVVGVGSLTGNANYIQMQSQHTNARPSNGIVFFKIAGVDPIASGGAAIAFGGSPTISVGIEFGGAVWSTAPYILGNNSFPLARNSAAATKIIGGIDATDFMLFQSGGAGVRWIDSANTINLLLIAETGAATLVNSLTGPSHFGGTAIGSTLTLKGSSHASATAGHILANTVTSGVSPGGLFIGAPASASISMGNLTDTLHLQGSDGLSNAQVMDTYNNAALVSNNIVFRTARGTFAAPTATQANDPLGIFGARGYETNTPGFAAANNARIVFFAQDTFTSAAQGTYITLETTPAGSVTRAESVRITGEGDLRILRPQITPGSGTGLTVNDAGSVQREVHKVTVTFAALSCAALTCDKTIATLPAKTRLVGIIADTTTVYAGGAVTAASIIVGKTVGGNEYILTHSVFGATVVRGLVDADLGASISRATAVQGGDLPSWTATTNVSVRLTTVTANTNALTQGSTTYYLVTEKHP